VQDPQGEQVHGEITATRMFRRPPDETAEPEKADQPEGHDDAADPARETAEAVPSQAPGPAAG
jgi:hypothetical protein